jgi:hypothetical protein
MLMERSTFVRSDRCSLPYLGRNRIK